MENPRRHIRIAVEGNLLFDRRILHRESAAAALEMLVGEDGPAYDRQIRIASDEIVRELFCKARQLLKGPVVDHHRRMLLVQDNAVLVVVDIRRILQIPSFAAHRDRNDPVIFPGRMIRPACVPDIFRAQLAHRIARRLFPASSRDETRILFRLRQVYRDIEIAEFGLRLPPQILFAAFAADIVRDLRELIIPVRRSLRALRFVDGTEFLVHLRRPGRHNAHQLRVEEIPFRHRISAQSVVHRVVRQKSENFGQRLL